MLKFIKEGRAKIRAKKDIGMQVLIVEEEVLKDIHPS